MKADPFGKAYMLSDSQQLLPHGVDKEAKVPMVLLFSRLEVDGLFDFGSDGDLGRCERSFACTVTQLSFGIF